jgi:Zn-dependent protease with chaperone function
MLDLITLVLCVWGVWCLLQVALLLVVPPVAHAFGFAVTNGLTIVIPDRVRAQLTPEELDAVLAHERGHIHHLHAIENLALACIFLSRTPQRALQQELEADDFAAQQGHAAALARAIGKLSNHPVDQLRARRLQGVTP